MGAKEPTKVVVRLLPPLITEDELLSTIGEEHVKNATLRSFVEGKRYKGDKPSKNALCYLYFGSSEHSEAFIRDYHGHQFVDDQGEQFRAVACYAPYQKVPKHRGKDPREGTIEDDKEYQQFVENLSKPKEAFVAPEDPKHSLKPAEPGDTPLLQHLRTKAKEKKERAEKRRNKKWWPEEDAIAEDEPTTGKRAKWRCGECGAAKNLEEDPDNRGNFYCTFCWEAWEAQPVKKSKKKKKSQMYEEEEWKEEASSKKSKKKKDKEAAAAEDWYGTTEETEGKRSRKKKKDREAQSWAEEEWSSSHWRSKDDSGWEEAPAKKEKKSKSKKGDERWVEKSDAAQDDGQGRGSRWRKKGEAEEAPAEKEEKPRRSRKDRSHREESWW